MDYMMYFYINISKITMKMNDIIKDLFNLLNEILFILWVYKILNYLKKIIYLYLKNNKFLIKLLDICLMLLFNNIKIIEILSKHLYKYLKKQSLFSIWSLEY